MQKAELDKLEQQAKDALEGDELQEVLSDIAELKAMPSLEEYMTQFTVEIKRPPVFTVRSWRDAVRLLASAIVTLPLAAMLVFLFISAGGWLFGGLAWSEVGRDISIALAGSLLFAWLLYWLMRCKQI